MMPIPVTPLFVLVMECETVDEVHAQQTYEAGHMYGTPWAELEPELRASIVHELGEARRVRLRELREHRKGAR